MNFRTRQPSRTNRRRPPAIRPLFLAEPYDPASWTHPDRWLAGERTVAPDFR